MDRKTPLKYAIFARNKIDRVGVAGSSPVGITNLKKLGILGKQGFQAFFIQ
ncbi:hypothetical protein ACIQLG_15690 [Terribacillus saccharophilus]|uniref:hypothetical protein n=1 Tax=Terribacillus saccharophilus TaxID=361277 RepID=UPI0038013CE0